MSKRKVEEEVVSNKKQNKGKSILPKPQQPVEQPKTPKLDEKPPQSDSEEEKEQKIYTEQELKSLSINKIREICDENGINSSGRKGTLIQKILASQEDDKNETVEKNKDFKDGDEVLKKLNELKVKGNISRCLIQGILNNHVSLSGDKPLQNLVTKANCYSCSQELTVLVSDVVNQADVPKGSDSSTGIKCTKCKSFNFITSMCTGNLSTCEALRKYHCNMCPGFGKCQSDYREEHCYRCGSHYWGGKGSVGCSCSFFGKENSRKASKKRDCSIM